MSTSSGDSSALFPGRPFIATVLELWETKTAMSDILARRYLQRAAMAGVIIGILYVVYFAIVAAFSSTALAPLGRVIAAATFGWALVFIYYSRSELLTSNMMVVTVGAYHHRTGWLRALRLLGLCYLGNVLGGLAVAVLIRFSTVAAGAPLAEMEASVAHKLQYLTEGVAGWSDLLIRAVLCNLCINLAMLLVYNGFIKGDVAKSLVMVVAVFVFAYLGLEHSVANTVLFEIVGLSGGVPLGLVAANLGIVLVGNYIGGGLLIGLYYAYANDETRTRRGRVTE